MTTQHKDSHVCLALIDGRTLEYDGGSPNRDYDPNYGSSAR